jgi:uncharacterized protein (TIGR04222 family)
MLRKGLVVFLLLAVLALPVAAQDKSYSADRFDVDVAVQRGGSLNVTETVDFRFVGGPFSYVFREIPTDHTDGIVNIQAGADGVSWPHGTGPGQVEIETGDPIRVTWHLSPTSNRVQTFDLSYDALGVVRQGEDADLLEWQALPESYEYTIAASEVVFTYPTSAALLTTPALLESRGDVTVGENQVRVSAGNIGPDEPLIVRLNFAPGSIVSEPPAWQAQQEALNDRAWIWAALAGLILMGGGAAIFLAARPYRRQTRRSEGISYVPPSDLSPAIVGALAGNGTGIGWQHALATLFALANRGIIEIAEMDKRKWYEAQDFEITLLSTPTDLSPDEQALFELLFTDKSGGRLTTITATEMGKLVTSGRWNNYQEALKNEMILTDLISPKRQTAVTRFLILGALLALGAVVLFIAAILLGPQLGYWTVLPAVAVLVLGILAFIVAATISTRSERGEQVAAMWQPYRRYLEQAAKGKERIPNPELFAQYLPYAMAFGVAENWAKQNEKAGWDEAPGYFRTLGTPGHASTGAFIAILAATNSSGGAAAATAGACAAAGAAGGGASGAG